jgi:chaperonin GroEL (HSP60 family)
VTRLALQNAASIASLLLTTDCLIATPAAPMAERTAAMAPEY